jgi:zinc transport system substrate-binding protein
VLTLVGILAIGALLLGCPRKPPPPRMKVVVTVFPIYDLTRRIAGPDADVVLLLPVGRPEMDFEPTDREAAEAADAKIGINVGLGLDDWMQELLDRVAPKAKRVTVGDRVPTMNYKRNTIAAMLSHQGQPEVDARLDTKPDPHVWLDPGRAELIVKAIAEEMARSDSTRAAAYRQRAAELETDLEKLDRETMWRIQSWGTKAFVAFRPGFTYYAAHYGIEILATLEVYPGVVPPLHYTQEVVRIVRANRIAGVFTEPQFKSTPANIVGAATHVPLGVMDVVGGQAETDTYDKLIRFNTDALEKVLKAPPLPMLPDGGGAVDAGDARDAASAG